METVSEITDDMQKKDIVVLGSTGSIGVQTLDVASALSLRVKALAAYSNIELLEQQARRYHPKYICVFKDGLAPKLKLSLSDTDIVVLSGMSGLCELAQLENVLVVNAVVGMVGLQPTLKAIEAGNDIALANKETLVVGGELVMRKSRENNVNIFPVDSEHSAIFQALQGNTKTDIHKILLTASGGPFYGYSSEQLRCVTKAQALKHPNWEMGQKITIDSATLMNKGLELIEAVHLFDISPDDIEILVHRQSIVHSAIEYRDGSVMAQLGSADMRIPIQYAITYPRRYDSPAKKLNLLEVGTLTFDKPDYDTFVCLASAKKAIKMGGNAPCIVNSANEEAVRLFLDDKIKFYQIGELVVKALETISNTKEVTLESILETEALARNFVLKTSLTLL